MPRSQRIQLRRQKGWRLQEASRRLNGLPAVKVDRSTFLGNPFTVGDLFTAQEAVEHFRDMMTTPCLWHRALPELVARSGLDKRTIAAGLDVRGKEIQSRLRDLIGHNVACWCDLDAPCHGDVLIELCEEYYPADCGVHDA